MSYPGLIQPTTQSYTLGAGNARDSAMLANKNMNMKQCNLANAVGGKRKRRYRGGATDQVVVPQFSMNYNVVNGKGTSPNDQIASLSSTGMQSASWSSNDYKATTKGGTKRRHKKGGNPDWLWGCYSGGKRKRTKRRKSSKRSHSRRH